MKKLFVAILGCFFSVSGFSQSKTADIGIWGGTSGYLGDIEGNTFFQSPNPFFGAYFRYNFNPRISARGMLLTGNIAGEGVIQEQPWEFSKGVQDLTIQAEINYLRYMLGSSKASFSSYVTAGLGVMYYRYELDPAAIYQFNQRHNKGTAEKKNSVIAPAIPFGIGFKFNVGKRLGLGVEYQMRKILDDKLDNLDDPLAYLDSGGKEVTYNDLLHNNDWATYLGIHLTYRIYLGSKPCPAYDSKN